MKVRCVWPLTVCLLLAGQTAWAQRDPTQPPFADRSAGTSAQPAGAAQASSWAVIVVDGRPHLVVGTKLYAEGEQFGAARIERITETEIWLRQGGTLRKNAIYRGVTRRNVPAPDPCKTEESGTLNSKPASGRETCERK